MHRKIELKATSHGDHVLIASSSETLFYTNILLDKESPFSSEWLPHSSPCLLFLAISKNSSPTCDKYQLSALVNALLQQDSLWVLPVDNTIQARTHAFYAPLEFISLQSLFTWFASLCSSISASHNLTMIEAFQFDAVAADLSHEILSLTARETLRELQTEIRNQQKLSKDNLIVLLKQQGQALASLISCLSRWQPKDVLFREIHLLSELLWYLLYDLLMRLGDRDAGYKLLQWQQKWFFLQIIARLAKRNVLAAGYENDPSTKLPFLASLSFEQVATDENGVDLFALARSWPSLAKQIAYYTSVKPKEWVEKHLTKSHLHPSAGLLMRQLVTLNRFQRAMLHASLLLNKQMAEKPLSDLLRADDALLLPPYFDGHPIVVWDGSGGTLSASIHHKIRNQLPFFY